MLWWKVLRCLIYLLISAVLQGFADPICEPEILSIKIAENSTVGSTVASLSCSSDNPHYDGNITFTKSSDGSQFRVHPASGDVYLANPLDYNTTKFHTVNILVSEEGPEAKRIVFFLYVMVTPVYDFPLRITNLNPIINDLPETSLGNVIVTINTTYDNTRYNDSQLFYITGGNGERRFYIDHYTGSLYVVKALDYETTTSYSVQINATDGGLQSVSTNVTINIADVVEYPPDCRTFCTVKFREDSYRNRPGASICDVAAQCEDLDASKHSVVTFTTYIRWMRDYKKFDHHPLGGVKLKRSIDPDTEPNTYLQEFGVRKYGMSPQMTSTVAILVTIEGADDNPTVWPQRDMVIDISEDLSPSGIAIMTLEAKDADPPNRPEGRIRYGLYDEFEHFYVHPMGGIFLIKELDREVEQEVILHVFAFTESQPNLRIPAFVIIRIEDVNDYKPTFTEGIYYSEISENEDYNKDPFLTVTAKDLDDGENGRVEYSLPESFNGRFRVGRNTGELFTFPLDYETAHYYNVTIVATDGGMESLSGSVAVIVNIRPENEFAPLVDDTIVVEIQEGAAFGSNLTAVKAFDADEGKDGDLTYTTSTDTYPLMIGYTTGLITIVGPLDRERTASYSFEVIVADSSSVRSLSATSTVKVAILDKNDNSPVCEPPVFSVVVSTSTLENAITHVNCTDFDEGLNSKLRYFIVDSSSENFSVDDFGQISINRSPILSEYMVRVWVEDSGTPPLGTAVIVLVKFHIQPPILNLQQTINVLENVTISSELYHVNASSPGKLDYQIISGNNDGRFVLGKSTGRFYLTKKLDKETDDSFSLVLRVYDETTDLETRANLNIFVEDVNDNPPRFPNSFYHVRVAETVPTSSVILNLTATDADVDTRNNQIYYSIKAGNIHQRFSIDSDGDLRIVSQLNLELKRFHRLIIEARDSLSFQGLSDSTVVEVEVVKVGDHPSVDVLDTNANISVPEDLAVGDVITQVGSANLQKENVRFYLISGEKSTFYVDSGSGKIYLASPLDRESVDEYEIVISASTKISSKASTFIIGIKVTDVNDNDPQFSEEHYTIELSRGELDGKSVLLLNCSDLDDGDNSKFTITIISGNDEGYFRIENAELKLEQNVTNTTKRFFNLVIESKDHGIPARSTTAAISMTITDGPNPPKFFPNSEFISVPDDTPAGSEIFDCDATSLGSPESKFGTVLYSLVQGVYDKLFLVNPNTGKLFSLTSLSSLKETIINLKIRAEDKNRPDLMDEFDLTISIEDVNNNSPNFSKLVYLASVSPHGTNGTNVTTVRATDADKGLNAKLTYRLAGDDSADFNVHPSTGLITVKKKLGHKPGDTYLITVFATDSGTPRKSSQASVIITVDSNQNHPPVFPQSKASTSIQENSDIGKEVYKIVAFDTDENNRPLNDLVYSIEDGNIDGSFAIDSSSGSITIAHNLDRENKDFYTLLIKCEDTGVPPLSSEAFVDIHITDVNDNSPTFSRNSFAAFVPSTAEIGYQILQVSATDADINYNAYVIFDIISGNELDLFALDVYSGTLSVSSNLTATHGDHVLVVKATDAGSPPLYGFANFTLKIAEDPNYVFSVPENRPAQELVGNIKTTGNNTYTIVAGDSSNAFSSHPIEGKLKTSKTLDREERSEYQLTILITDSQIPTNWYSLLVTVNVEDENDNAPTFGNSEYFAEVLEGTAAGFAILDLDVSDTDADFNAALHFEILDPESDSLFSVSDDTLKLTTKAPMSHARHRVYDFILLVVDRGIPTRSGQTIIHVTITQDNKNTNPPNHGSLFISLECPFNEHDGFILFSLSLKSLGIQRSAPDSIEYIFEHSDDSPFVVNNQTGNIVVWKSDLLAEDATYRSWLVVKAVWEDYSAVRQGIVRVDTFDPVQNVVDVTLNISASDLAENGVVDEIISELTSLIPQGHVKLWEIRPVTTRQKRSAGTTLGVYGVLSDDDVSDVTKKKVLMSDKELWSYFNQAVQQNQSIGSNQTYKIQSVRDYHTPQGLPGSAEALHQTTSKTVAVSLLCTAAVLLVLLIVLYCVYRRTARVGTSIGSDTKGYDTLNGQKDSGVYGPDPQFDWNYDKPGYDTLGPTVNGDAVPLSSNFSSEGY